MYSLQWKIKESKRKQGTITEISIEDLKEMILQAEGDSDVMIDMACKKALFRLVVMEFRGLRISCAYMCVRCDKSKKIIYKKEKRK